MKKLQHFTLGFLIIFFISGNLSAKVKYDDQVPQLAFAAQEIEKALKEVDKENLKISLIIEADESNPEAFRIRNTGKNSIEVIGSDASGAMYGGLEVAEQLQLGIPIKDQEQKPYVEKRGVKINIPLDIRTPSFDDSGEAAQRNVITMWDFSFWKEYLDDLARYRYNVVSLWAAHPFPNLIKLEDYPDVAMDDVHYIDPDKLDASLNKNGDDIEYTGDITAVKKMSIDEKIDFWTKVFDYAADRGIEIIMVHWNFFTPGATGKYGITPEQDNPKTIEYLRACVKEMLLTYPQITGIGVCAGENDDKYLRDEYMSENVVFNSYGKAVMDVMELQPDRDIRMIVRRHSTERKDIENAFKDFTGGPLEVSVKYAVAHMYSSRRPQEWEKRIIDQGWNKNHKAWLNLRNDDIFMHRWGSPDFARDFIKWLPHDDLIGFYMGSDTYVWGREFISKNPEMSGKLEIDKHWYNFKLWGQLAYNDDLNDEYWAAVLEHRFPGVNGMQLLKAWEAVSEVIPQVNRFAWSPTDGSFGAEACRRTSGFLYVDGFCFDRPPMILDLVENAPDPQCVSVTEWAKAYLAGEEIEGLLPLQVAENLDGFAEVALKALPKLKAQIGDNIELKETLNDIESMAYLGRYYADKIRGAAKLALYRESGREEQKYLDESIAHLEDAVKEWKSYADVLERQYKTQIGSRANNQDWYGTLKFVKKEVDRVKEEGDYPEVSFANLEDMVKIAEGSDLIVKVEASDGNGAPEVSLRLRGILLKADNSENGMYVWSASRNNLLKSMKSGIYHLEAAAVDKNGLRTSTAISVIVGDVKAVKPNAWRDEIYEVILKEGEKFWEGDVAEFPDLNCYLSITDEGSISLRKGTPKHNEGGIWATSGKANRPKWKVKPEPDIFNFYLAVEDGQMRLWREKEGRPTVLIYETPKVSGSGPFKLGITADRSLAVFRESGDKTEIVWKSN